MLLARELAAVAAASQQDVRRLASYGLDSESSTLSTPRSYVAFSTAPGAPTGKLFSWQDVAVRTDHREEADGTSVDEAKPQVLAQEGLKRPPSQGGKKLVPMLRLDML